MGNDKAPPVNGYRARRKRERKRFERLHGQPAYWDHGILYFYRSGLLVPVAPEIRKPGSGHVHAQHAHKTPASSRPIHISQLDRERGSQPRRWYNK